jgi:hypothetical protein
VAIGIRVLGFGAVTLTWWGVFGLADLACDLGTGTCGSQTSARAALCGVNQLSLAR